MTNDVSTEVIRRIHIDRHYLEVGENGDNPDFIELRTATTANKEYFGEVRLTLSPDAARQLGEALVEAALEKR